MLAVIVIVSIVLVFKIVINIARLIITYKTNPVSSLNNKVRIISYSIEVMPLSHFLTGCSGETILILHSDNGNRMLTHELTHINEHHSVDKIFTEVLICVFWINPFFWLMRRELNTVHEFLADRRAINQQDGAAFAAMILQCTSTATCNNKRVGQSTFFFTN